MEAYEQAHLELTDRLQELIDTLAEHRRDALAADAEERRIYVDDLNAWAEVLDSILSGAITGTEYRNRAPVLFW